MNPHARDWLKGKTAEDFEILEHEGRLYWPVVVRQLKADRSWKELHLLARVLGAKEIAQARRDQELVFSEELGFSGENDRERHADIYEEVGVYAHVAFALRVNDPPNYGRWTQTEYLYDVDKIKVPRSEVYNLHGQLEVFGAFENSRLEELSAEQLVELVLAIDGVRNLSPLAGIAGRALDAFVIGSASLLASYLRNERPLQSNGTSTSARKRGASPSSSSSTSSSAETPMASTEPSSSSA